MAAVWVELIVKAPADKMMTKVAQSSHCVLEFILVDPVALADSGKVK